MELPVNQIMNGDALIHLKELPDQCVNMVMTSPPYWALRDYGIEGQLGLEQDYEDYVNKLCDIFDETRRVLRDDGTIWINLGDTYWGSGSGTQYEPTLENSKEVYVMPYNSAKIKQRSTKWKDKVLKKNFKPKDKFCCECGKKFMAYPKQYFCSPECSGVDNTPRVSLGLPESKSLIGIPFRFAIEMVNRGWILRNTIIWYKPNAMPSSAKDRFNVDFEYIFLFSKKKNYYFETQYEPISEVSKNDKRLDKGRFEYNGKRKRLKEAYLRNPPNNYDRMGNSMIPQSEMMGISSFGRNKRTVWAITTKPYSEAHFATYPEELCETPIRAGCPKNGIVLDMFFGAGTTGLVALKQNKKFIGIELNPEYIKIAQNRLKPYLEQQQIQFVKDEENVK